MLPATCGLKKLRSVVEAARRGGDSRPVITVLFHEFDFVESGDRGGHISLEQFDELLGWVAAQDDLECVPAETLVKGACLGEERLRPLVLQYWLSKIVPPLFPNFPDRWLPDRSAAAVVMRGALLAGAFYGALLSGTTLLCFWEVLSNLVDGGLIMRRCPRCLA